MVQIPVDAPRGMSGLHKATFRRAATTVMPRLGEGLT